MNVSSHSPVNNRRQSQCDVKSEFYVLKKKDSCTKEEE